MKFFIRNLFVLGVLYVGFCFKSFSAHFVDRDSFGSGYSYLNDPALDSRMKEKSISINEKTISPSLNQYLSFGDNSKYIHLLPHSYDNPNFDFEKIKSQAIKNCYYHQVLKKLVRATLPISERVLSYMGFQLKFNDDQNKIRDYELIFSSNHQDFSNIPGDVKLVEFKFYQNNNGLFKFIGTGSFTHEKIL